MSGMRNIICKGVAILHATCARLAVQPDVPAPRGDHLRRDIGIDDAHCRDRTSSSDRLRLEIRRLQGRL